MLTDLVGADLLPKQVRFGNDEVVDDEIVDEIAAAYAGGERGAFTGSRTTCWSSTT